MNGVDAGVTAPTGPVWRPVAAALADPGIRAVWARLVLGASVDDAVAPLPPAKRARALASLRAAGLVDDDGAVTDVFRRLLRSGPVRAPRTGVDRFLRGGRIDTYPASRAERRELLAWVVERAVAPGEELDEKALGTRLAAFHDDVAVLRRYLVDAELLERTRDGALYARPTAPGT